MDEVIYVVYLKGVPISAHKWPWAAIQEATERTTTNGQATVTAYKKSYTFGGEPDFEQEEPTDPRCTPCAHDYPCDGEWKKNV